MGRCKIFILFFIYKTIILTHSGAGYSENKAFLTDSAMSNVTDVYRKWYANKKYFNTKTNECTGKLDDCAAYINVCKYKTSLIKIIKWLKLDRL